MRTTDHHAAVRVVTDSTACLPPLPPGSTDPAGPGSPLVVPLQVTIGDASYREGVDISDDDVARRIAAGERVLTSQPAPAAFAAAYRRLADDGARAVVSVHLSGELSGTVHVAALAGSRAPLPVQAVDARTAAMGLGFAAREAARCAAAGCDAEHVARRALEVADSARTVLLVDALDHLRRGGRLSGPAAALGSVLGVRPLLELRAGRIEVVQKVRTRVAALDRLVEVARAAAGRRRSPLLAVHHLGAPEAAEDLAARVGDGGMPVVVTSVGAVLGAHVGPGALAVVVADAGDHRH